MREPLFISGSFGFINDGNVTQIGDTGLYLVENRTAEGTLGDDEFPGLESDIEGSFSMTYNAIIAIADQSGPLFGTMEFEDEEEDETYTAFFHARSEGELISFDPEKGGSMEIDIIGHLQFIDNAWGRADFEGSVEVMLDKDGHIVGFGDSTLTIDGYWNPDIDNRWDPHVANRWSHHTEDYGNPDGNAVLV